MRICGIQFDIAWERPDENFRRVRELATEAVASGARLVVLPEMFATGFSMRAEEVARHGPETVEFLRGLARDLDVAVVGGLAEDGRKMPANAAWALAPDGEVLAHYRKIHPFSLAGEQEHFEAGDALSIFGWEGLRIGVFICYDLRFPEPFRAAASEVDLMLVIANWPAVRSHAWRSLLVARAIENQCYLLGVNRVGVAQGHEHSGDSALVDPRGEVLCELRAAEGIVAGEVDPDFVAADRKRFSFLFDRRFDLYPRLAVQERNRGGQ